ncbi:hypothetical protein JOF56_000788 [Kibdelosporangium banguiense]|uniref:Uncharacterized protein n=1 Tax=Kibdelosporangium banguiense TaxID=1365924 RepID=A0ABS4T7K9_9PSEU|nr:DUF6193 family natural product biosynthesis protein [Kibdelosporangium banguiense]MBP2320403.1 hypothetical protein [Kibdelosporangium banguiense]
MGESPYQDLVDAGGLRAVIEVACLGCEITVRDAPGAFGGYVVEASKGDRAVTVFPHRDKRLFRVRHKLRTAYLSWVATADLTGVTGLAASWLGGATPQELADVWPFADFVDVATAYESGDRIEFMWQQFRAHPRHDLGEFIDAAMTEPQLRRMYPFMSMYWMSFRPTADEYRVPGPWVRAVGDGRFTIVEDRRVEPDITFDAGEAVRVCLTEMDRLGVPSSEELSARERSSPSGLRWLDGSSG